MFRTKQKEEREDTEYKREDIRTERRRNCNMDMDVQVHFTAQIDMMRNHTFVVYLPKMKSVKQGRFEWT